MGLKAIFTPKGLHNRAQGRRRRTLGTEPRRSSTWFRVSLPSTRFGVVALWNPVGVRWIQMAHEMNGCEPFPFPGCAARPWALMFNACGVKR